MDDNSGEDHSVLEEISSLIQRNFKTAIGNCCHKNFYAVKFQKFLNFNTVIEKNERNNGVANCEKLRNNVNWEIKVTRPKIGNLGNFSFAFQEKKKMITVHGEISKYHGNTPKSNIQRGWRRKRVYVQ